MANTSVNLTVSRVTGSAHALPLSQYLELAFVTLSVLFLFSLIYGLKILKSTDQGRT